MGGRRCEGQGAGRGTEREALAPAMPPEGAVRRVSHGVCCELCAWSGRRQPHELASVPGRPTAQWSRFELAARWDSVQLGKSQWGGICLIPVPRWGREGSAGRRQRAGGREDGRWASVSHTVLPPSPTPTPSLRGM